MTLTLTKASDQFVTLCRGLLCHRAPDELEAFAAAHGDGRMQSTAKAIAKGAVAGQSTADGWLSTDGTMLSDAYLSTVRPFSVLDTLAQFAVQVPLNVGQFTVASGMAAQTVDEGAVKAVTRATAADLSLIHI